ALYAFQGANDTTRGWWLLVLGLALGAHGQVGVEYPAPPPGPRPLRPSWTRIAIGVLLAAIGIGLWAMATATLLHNWAEGFDRAWAGWLSATVLMAIGADLAWGVWPAPAE